MGSSLLAINQPSLLQHYKMSRAYLRCRTFFRDFNNNPFELTPNQTEIFRLVADPTIKRVAIKAITQYGKSEVVSMAIAMLMSERKEKVLIIAPSDAQAQIIMGNVIGHFFDHPYLQGMLEFQGKQLEQLKQEKSKKRITLKNGSEIRCITADAKSVKREGRSLMGFGATLVVVDESTLIPDVMYSKILRMVGGTLGKIVQLGNPFEDNHFEHAFKSPRYQTVVVDWQVALAEGRITQDFLDEAKEEMTEMDWMVFYECKVPKKGRSDAVIPLDWIELAVDQADCRGEYKQAGLDVARFGDDKIVYILRRGGEVRPEDMRETQKLDTMEVVGWVKRFIDKDEPELTNVDVIGIGAGVYDKLDEDGYEVEEINFGEGATDPEAKKKYHNLRAQVYWHLRKMFKPNKDGHSQISIPNHKGLIEELKALTYSYSSEKRIKIVPKDELKKTLGRSPDHADALALAFWDYAEQEPDMFIVAG